LKGPGYVSRFWFTGVYSDHPVRFYFDNETTPRLDTTLRDYCGGQEPFCPPLAGYENYGWYSFVPIPYRQRLVIEARENLIPPTSAPRLYYQVNFMPLPRGQTVESFPRQLTAADLEIARQVRRVWSESLFARNYPNARQVETNAALPAGAVADLFQLTGPAVLRRLWIEPDFAQIASPLARERLLRDVVLRVRWNGSPAASVEAPLGDFFGSCWQRARYQSMFFGLTNDTFGCGFPMPFASAARITLDNQGTQAVVLKAGALVEPLSKWDPAWGYFHAGWQRTGLEDVGRPHPILRVQGRGKYVGCLLAAICAEPSFWMLEGDESIRKDKEEVPGWRGTGLEDYFNGAFYYQNVRASPLHGLPFKASFRTVQYSLHLVNPTLFDSSLDMVFERGPNQASRGWLESVAYYYMAEPCQAFARLGLPPERQPPQTEFNRATVMMELYNYERFGDYRGASEYIDRYLEQYPQFPFPGILRLRQIAYQERAQGFEAVRARYEQIAAAETNELVKQFANVLLWYQQASSNALLGAYANTPTKIFLDGKEIGFANDAQRLLVSGIQLAPGRHVLAMESKWHQYPSWAAMLLRTHWGDVCSGVGWKHTLNPPPGWLAPDYDDSSWKMVRSGAKGPPDEVCPWVMPEPFVALLSKALGLMPEMEWPDRQGTVGYRKVFELK
jgi:hypothetical protein